MTDAFEDYASSLRNYGIAPFALPYQNRTPKLGTIISDTGVDFALFSGNASAVELCLFELSETDGVVTSETRYRLHPGANGIWTGHIPNIGVGQVYGYRISGPWNPAQGLRYNPHKVLLDPYARGVIRLPHLDPALYAFEIAADFTPINLSYPNSLDSQDFAPLAVVLPDSGTSDNQPRIPWAETVIYETHVVGQTKLNPHLPEELRGTYAGLAHPESIKYFKELGVTAIELLPIHLNFSEPFLTKKGLENYWGYNTLAFFCPEPSYATKAAQEAGPAAVLEEVKGMVSLLHDAGLEVILDVVYNHSCEGGVDGPSLSWRGIDNTGYYRHYHVEPGTLRDTTGCGNSLDFRRTEVIQLTLDSLRYWVQEVGVDGFRFDLAATLSREGDIFNHRHPLYLAMATDPLLKNVKLINEPWDVGPNGWQTGGFPAPTVDWNDRYRDTVRNFWITNPPTLKAGDSGHDLRDFATRLSGSADLFGRRTIPSGSGAHTSINFVTAHDGFSMRDLVSFNHKHNEANLEDNRDGSDHNRSWNHGVEGDTNLDASSPIWQARLQTIRNLLGTLILSAGTPMLRAGDEQFKTQHGNNNAYCQNNEITWLTWDDSPESTTLFEITGHLIRLRRENPTLRPLNFYSGVSLDEFVRDLQWFDAHGKEMSDAKWHDPSNQLLQMLRGTNPKHNNDVSISGDSHNTIFSKARDVLIIFNGSPQAAQFQLASGHGTGFTLVWDSTWERIPTSFPRFADCAHTLVPELSMRVYFAND
ncbi:MAG: glycogen debranching protein GlgX [Arcanobacterium sp.]|nr:glycogen debranching protein GlgX [Arcanobacterium sp.]